MAFLRDNIGSADSLSLSHQAQILSVSHRQIAIVIIYYSTCAAEIKQYIKSN